MIKLNSNNPLISVLMAAYNAEEFIQKSIDSVKKQIYKNWELIIIDDASTDRTFQIAKKNKNQKIKIISLKKNLGPYLAQSKAIKYCRGKYIAILDADDLMHRDKIYKQFLEFKKDKKIGLVVSWYKIIDNKGKILNSIKEPKNYKQLVRLFPCKNLICNSSAMFKKDLFENLNFYNKSFYYSNDYNFYLKIFVKYKIKILKKFYTFYRIHNNQRTQSTTLKKIIIKENLMHLRWAMNNNLINSKNIFIYYKTYFKNLFKNIFI